MHERMCQDDEYQTASKVFYRCFFPSMFEIENNKLSVLYVHVHLRGHSDSEVECLTPEGGAAGSSVTV